MPVAQPTLEWHQGGLDLGAARVAFFRAGPTSFEEVAASKLMIDLACCWYLFRRLFWGLMRSDAKGPEVGSAAQ